MGGPAARIVDDALRFGLVYHVWPLRQLPGALPASALRYLMTRTTALMPSPPADEEPDV